MTSRPYYIPIISQSVASHSPCDVRSRCVGRRPGAAGAPPAMGNIKSKETTPDGRSIYEREALGSGKALVWRRTAAGGSVSDRKWHKVHNKYTFEHMYINTNHTNLNTCILCTYIMSTYIRTHIRHTFIPTCIQCSVYAYIMP